jgi:regulatory protein
MEAAAVFLAVRPRSIAETRRRLLHLGFPGPVVEDVVAHLTRLGYLDDAAFASAWVESRDRARPRGAAALRRELMLRGVDRPTVDLAIAGRTGTGDGMEGDPSSEAEAEPDILAARRLLARRAAALARESDPRRRRHKAYALLARSGFDPETCASATAEFLAAPAGEDREG